MDGFRQLDCWTVVVAESTEEVECGRTRNWWRSDSPGNRWGTGDRPSRSVLPSVLVGQVSGENGLSVPEVLEGSFAAISGWPIIDSAMA